MTFHNVEFSWSHSLRSWTLSQTPQCPWELPKITQVFRVLLGLGMNFVVGLTAPQQNSSRHWAMPFLDPPTITQLRNVQMHESWIEWIPKIWTERGGFEPPLGLTLKQISSLPHSTTLPPLQMTMELSNTHKKMAYAIVRYSIVHVLVILREAAHKWLGNLQENFW